MFKSIFGTRPTNKIDVFIAIGGAVMALIHASSTYHEFKKEQENKEITQ